MRIGITGSAGFLGANLVKTLYSAASGPITCFYSKRRYNPLTADLDLDYRHLDVTSAKQVLERTRGLDVLFHLAGVVDYSQKQARRIWEVNVLGARNIFESVIRNRIERLVYISSINVLGTVRRGLADESNPIYGSPGNPISFRNREEAIRAVEDSLGGDYGFLARSRVPYFDSKLAAYELAMKYCREARLPLTVVFPGTAVGPGDVGESITRLVYRIYQGRLRVTLPGSTPFVASGDVAAGIWLAYQRGKEGESYIISGAAEDNMSYRDFMRLVATVARNRYNRRVPRRFLPVPAGLCRLLAGFLRILSLEGELTPALILSGTAKHRFSHAKAAEQLGYSPRISLEQAVESCIDFYLHRSDAAAAEGISGASGSSSGI